MINSARKPLKSGDLSQFTGSQNKYRTSVNRNVVISEGVLYLAEAGQAFWLVTEIALRFGTTAMARAIAEDDRLSQIQFWQLDVNADRSATLTATADSDEPPFIEVQIPATDFPLATVRIWASSNGFYWTLYLPTEH